MWTAERRAEMPRETRFSLGFICWTAIWIWCAVLTGVLVRLEVRVDTGRVLGALYA